MTRIVAGRACGRRLATRVVLVHEPVAHDRVGRDEEVPNAWDVYAIGVGARCGIMDFLVVFSESHDLLESSKFDGVVADELSGFSDAP